MSRVFWDTNLFIYLFEGSGPRTDRVIEVRQRMLDRRDILVTSTLTLGEILVLPLEQARDDLVDRYTFLLTSAAVALVPFDVDCARTFAGLRSDRTLRPPDAIQLACAARAGCDLFITNDDRLSSRTVPGIQFICSLDRAPL
ncbi:MAG: type II toxin-antitoxin system VapC family toxin [Armatimonadetes bacterium]|nr:type II toxin-antitoxin system VapC family toxin [Armatimonadota bacterium]